MRFPGGRKFSIIFSSFDYSSFFGRTPAEKVSKWVEIHLEGAILFIFCNVFPHEGFLQ